MKQQVLDLDGGEEDFKDMVAVITGGGGIICRQMAMALSEKGTKVALLDRNLSAAEAVAKEIRSCGGEAFAIQADVLDVSSLQSAQLAVNKRFGNCNILINGAGGNHPKSTTSDSLFYIEDLEDPDIQSFFDLSPKEIGFVFNLNFIGTLLPTQVFAREMLEVSNASIINISSMNAFRPLTKIPAYSAAKAAVSNFTQWLAVHFAETGIRVNAIAPGFFLTEQNRNLLTKEDGTLTDRGKTVIDHTPLNRFGNPEDLISTLFWLCDHKTKFVTGIVVPVDGGFSAYSGV